MDKQRNLLKICTVITLVIMLLFTSSITVGAAEIQVRSGSYGDVRLPDKVNRDVYNILKSKIAMIAENGGSTTITVSKDVFGDVSVSGTDSAAADALKAKFYETVKFGLILDCLLVDCPFELYWHDKTVGTRYSYTRISGGGRMYVDSFKVILSVNEEYQAEDSTAAEPKVNGGITVVSRAVAAAKKVVADNASKSDMEKLNAYKDYICSAVSYDESAAFNPSTAGGDPWQLISVFDGNSSTNVVCEGYSKAFQYLCDMSTFEDSGFKSYLVSGNMQDGRVSGGHMWNVVTLGGKNYFADLTNSDNGTLGSGGELFMSLAPEESDASGYTFHVRGSVVSYQYGEDMMTLYSAAIRTLSKAPIVATATAKPTATPTVRPTATPTVRPTATPTAKPTATPTAKQTATPTAKQTATPTVRPTATSTAKQTATPTVKPTDTSTAKPTAMPTASPAATQPTSPTAGMTEKPNATAFSKPTVKPTADTSADTVPTATYIASPTDTGEQTPVETEIVTEVIKPTENVSEKPTALVTPAVDITVEDFTAPAEAVTDRGTTAPVVTDKPMSDNVALPDGISGCTGVISAGSCAVFATLGMFFIFLKKKY